MKLKIIYSSQDPTEKWIIREKHIQGKILRGIICFTDRWMENAINGSDAFASQAIDKFIVGREKSPMVSSDRIRGLSIKEYDMFSTIMKTYGYKYNKKKDEFIKIIHEY